MKDLQCLRRGIIFHGKVNSEGFWIISLKTGENVEFDTKWALIKRHVVDLIHPTVPMLEPLSKMTEGDKKQYIANVRVMNYLLQAIPNDIYNSVDAFLAFKPHVLASRAKKAPKNHDPLALIAYSNASSSHSHANSSYSPQPYYVTHPPSVVDYDVEYQEELQGDSQEDKLITVMMLLAQAISQKFFTPTNNRLRVSSNTRNQAVVQDGRVGIQTKNAGYSGNANKNAGRNRTQGFNASDESNQIIQRVPRTESTPGKANVQEQMLLAMKDEAGSNLSNEENDFMLDTSYGEDFEELTAIVMLMARLQPTDENAETVPSYNAKAVSQVHASSKVHEQVSHGKRKTNIQTTNDD
ncbi:hypothetical protein Tco_0403332 [Tanacetum coccineum]